MKAIEKFSFFYRPEDDSGSVHLALEGGEATDIFTDSAGESNFLLKLLSQHKCYWNEQTGQISSGIEPAPESAEEE